MKKKKPYKILEEHLKYTYIEIELFKRKKIFSFGLLTSIGGGGMGHPKQGSCQSFFNAKNALRYIINHFKSPSQQAILRRFCLMRWT